MEKFQINEEIIQHLLDNNGFEFNLHKSSEEMQELGLVLNQKLIKGKHVDDQEIIDEIGDVIIRLNVLIKIYPQDKIQDRINKKLNNFKTWIETKKYKRM